MSADVRRVRLHELVERDGVLVDAATGERFDVETYSRMKHGDAQATRELGRRIGAALVGELAAELGRPDPVRLPVAYLHVEPACYHLSAFALEVINDFRSQRGLEPGRIVRVTKDSVTRTDYAASSMQARREEMARIRFSLDEPVTDAVVIIIDDVRVTGLAEETILRALEAEHPRLLALAYLATIGPGLRDDPAVEQRMNHAVIASVADMVEAASSGRFLLTIRFLKRVLGGPAEPRAAFLRGAPTDVLEQMRDGAVGTGDVFIADHAEGFADLEAELGRRAGPRTVAQPDTRPQHTPDPLATQPAHDAD